MRHTISNSSSIERCLAKHARRLLCSLIILLPAILGFLGACQPNLVKTDEQIAAQRSITVEQVTRLNVERGLNDKALEQMPDAVLRQEIFNLDNSEVPEGGSKSSSEQEVQPEVVPPVKRRPSNTRRRRRPRGARSSAIADGTSSANEIAPTGTSVAAQPTAGLDPTRWTSLGPTNIGGRTRSIAIDPTNPLRIFLGSAGGGVWLTEDGGQSYRPLDDQMANLIVTCMVMDPTNPKILYVGTGEDFFLDPKASVPRGAGIFKIVDGAKPVQLTSTDNPDFFYVNRLAISADGQTLLAATRNGLFRINNPDGAQWGQKLSFTVGDVIFDPRDSSKAIASGSDHGEVFFSTDGGESWQAATHTDAIQVEVPWDGRVELTYARANSSVVYASVSINSGEVWRSDDGGRRYVKMDSLDGDGNKGKAANYLGLQGRFSNTIWAGHPTNVNLVIVGGIELWRSMDGGKTLVDISSFWDARSAHVDKHCIVADPQYDGTMNKRVFFCTDGGLYKTEDVETVGNNDDPPRFNGWVNLSRGYGATQFNGGAGSPLTGMIVGGTQDNGTLRLAPSAGIDAWTEVSGNTGDGGFCAFDPQQPNFLYGSATRLNIFRSDDSGNCVEYISGKLSEKRPALGRCEVVPFPGFKDIRFLISDTLPPTGNTNSRRPNFTAPFVVDPQEGNRIFAGGISLWRTNDARTPNSQTSGPAWAAIKEPTTDGSAINAIALSRTDSTLTFSNLIWVAHNNGDVFKTTTINLDELNSQWQRVDENGQTHLPERICTRLTIDPRNFNIVYASFDSYAPQNVWKTSDGGLTWNSVSDTLPGIPVLSFAIHPDDSRLLYAGTTLGVFASNNGGQDWAAVGPANCQVNELFWLNNTLIAVTHGRGMFKADLTL